MGKSSLCIFKYLFFLAILSLYTSCEKKGCTDPNALNYDSNAKKDDNSCIYEEFDKKGLLENLTNNYIIPSIETYQNNINDLDLKVDYFIQSSTETNLLSLRNSWVDALLSWQDISFLDFGPAEYILLKSQTNIFPTDTTLIENNISSGSWNFDNSNYYDSKGLQALDYLINKRGVSDIEIANSFDTSQNAKNYLKAITEDLKTNITYVNDQWVNYKNDFIDDYETNSQGSSVSNLVNSLCLHYEFYIRRGKIGLPLGVFNGFSQQEMPELVECLHYGESLPFCIRSVSSLNDFINGISYTNEENGLGLDDYMNFVNAQNESDQLSTVINNQVDEIIIDLNNLNDPLSQEVVTNKSSVQSSYQKMQQLVPYLKVDMTSALGVLITYQDNDGD